MSISKASNPEAVHDIIREKYGEIARGESSSCCGDGCSCGGGESTVSIDVIGDAYEGVEGYVAEADLKLGCGVPVEHAGLAPGQTVLDLGSGAGLDAFVARRIVGENGYVIGVDLTPDMVKRARQNASMLQYTNVEFRHGDIEAMPVDDASVDVVISNCVLNLVPDKVAAFREIARVLRPGAHFCVSDMVTIGELPDAIRDSAAAYAGCVGGALEESAYLDIIRDTGLVDVEVVTRSEILVPEVLLELLPADIRSGIRQPALASITVRARRPMDQ